MSTAISDQMREDWNARAKEDAHYYVAFGRREQSEEEFFATARETVWSFETELKRLGPGKARARRALEIGCGPGRLMKPLAPHFGEIHGVDVSDEMVRLARERLRDVPYAHVHVTSGAELAQFADDSFDFVYSYAVFQHIPSREVVMEYLRETHRVLKPGGLARLQLNGLPPSARVYDTWSGVRITPDEIVAFTREYDFQVLALEGASTQYMWTSWIKRDAGWRARLRECEERDDARTRLRRITNAHSSEPVAPCRGWYAAVSVWVEHLPPEADLFDLEVRIGGAPVRAVYIGPPDASGVQQISTVLTESDQTGLMPVELLWFGEPLCPPGRLRVIPAGPAVPRLAALSDGVNLMAGTRIETGLVKVTLEDVTRPERFTASVDGRPVDVVSVFCVDPLPRRYEVDFRLPEGLAPGGHVLEIRLGQQRFDPVGIEWVGNNI